MLKRIFTIATIVITALVLLGISPTSADAQTTQSAAIAACSAPSAPQTTSDDPPIGTQDVYGPFESWGACCSSGFAGVLAGLWTGYNCWRDAYTYLWWLATVG
jgi:hypothetical protein